MASADRKKDENSGFSFGVRELRQAKTAGHPQARQRPQAPPVEAMIQPVQPGQTRGNDPYNTSGSFDRSRNWARVGKR